VGAEMANRIMTQLASAVWYHDSTCVTFCAVLRPPAGDAFVGAEMANRIMTGGPVLPPGYEVPPSPITSPNPNK
jgi:hypothetical protein